MPSYNEFVTVDNGRVIAFLAADIGPMIAPPSWIQSAAGMGPQLTVTMDSTVLIDGLSISGNTASGLGLRVNGARAWVDRSRIVQNNAGGIVAQNGAELTLRNCFVGGGGGSNPAATLNGSTGNISYTTLANTAFEATPALQCIAAATLTLRNSIVVTEGGTAGVEFDCAGANVMHSAMEALVPGDGNVAVGAFPDGASETWFVGLSAGDFHLQNDGLTEFADIARWRTGDPPTDIERNPRPDINDTADYAGADVP